LCKLALGSSGPAKNKKPFKKWTQCLLARRRWHTREGTPNPEDFN
jgi:hypothetical protein